MTPLEEVTTSGVVWHVKVAEPSMRRWYGLVLQLTLDGGLDVVHTWGRLPGGRRHPRRLIHHFADLGDALPHLARHVDRRRRRGYRVT